MANLLNRALTASDGTRKDTLDTTASDIPLGNVDAKIAGGMTLHVVDEGSWSGTLELKGILTGSGLAIAEGVVLPVVNRNSGASAASITAEGIYDVVGDNVDIHLVYTHTGGSVSVYSRRAIGAAGAGT